MTKLCTHLSASHQSDRIGKKLLKIAPKKEPGRSQVSYQMGQNTNNRNRSILASKCLYFKYNSDWCAFVYQQQNLKSAHSVS